METLNQLPNNHMESSASSPTKGIAAIAGLSLLLAVGIIIAIQYLPNPRGTQPNVAAAAETTIFPEVALIAKSAVVVDLTTGKMLFGLNPDTQLPLASLTKVPLVLVTADVLSLDSTITLPHTIQSADAQYYLLGGERWLLQDIVDFTLVTSSNDGAEFLASLAEETVRKRFPGAPTGESAVLWRMNKLTDELGLSETRFLNVSGLDISTTLAGSYGSARDMATLFGYALRSGTLAFSGTAEGNVLLTSQNGSLATVAENTNTAGTEIPGLIMGKTGFTDLAGGNLAIVFDASIGQPVAIVVLGSTLDGRFEDVQKLIDATRKTLTAR